MENRRVRGIVAAVACVAVLLAACERQDTSTPTSAPASRPGQTREMRVAAASDLKYAFEEVAAAFRKHHPDVIVTTTYGSSGNFFAQLSNDAPFDLFFSADVAYPQKLIDDGKASADTLFRYAIGRIIVWAPNESKLDVQTLGLGVLAEPSVKKVAIANPQHAPYGRAAEAAMKTAGVYDAVKGKLVLGENIAQAAQFVQSGSADVGVIALSLAVAPPIRGKGKYFKVPLDAYPRIEQGGVVLKWAKDPAAAKDLRDFMLGDEGRAILKTYGFTDAP